MKRFENSMDNIGREDVICRLLHKYPDFSMHVALKKGAPVSKSWNN